MNLTFVDILVGLVLVVSTFYAAWRGFLHETLAIFHVRFLAHLIGIVRWRRKARKWLF